MDKIAVIIRSKDSESTIAQVLKSLYSQTIKGFDLYLIDSGSKDKTVEIAKRFPCKISEIAPEDYFPGRVLNNAIRQTDAETIVFLNSDCPLLSPYALANLLKGLDGFFSAAAFARQLPRPDAKTWVKRDYLASFPKSFQAPWMFLSLPFAAIKRSVWEKHHFYDKSYGSEDTEWGFWARNNGFFVNYVPEALAMHSHNYTLKELYKRRYIEGAADLVIFNKKFGVFSFVKEWIKSTIRDIPFYLKERDFLGLFTLPLIRFVYHFGYFRGFAEKSPTFPGSFWKSVRKKAADKR